MQYKKTTKVIHEEKVIVNHIDSEDGRFCCLVGDTEYSEAFRKAKERVAEYEQTEKAAIWQRLVSSGCIVQLKADRGQLTDYCKIWLIYNTLYDGIDDYKLYVFKPKTGSDITDLLNYFKFVYFDALDPESNNYGLKDRGGYTWADVSLDSYKLEEGKTYLMTENCDGDWFRCIDLDTWISKVSSLAEWLKTK